MKREPENRFKRKSNIRLENKYIYIFTEGEETEPNYFESKKREIRKSTIHIEIYGKGHNTLSLVDYVLDFLSKRKILLSNNSDSDECWVVFDRDSFEKYDFDNAIAKAGANGIKVAYSNESFELWFLLHFKYLTTALNRDQINEKLNEIIKKKHKIDYAKNSTKMYSYIMDLENDAIRNAKNLLSKEHCGVKLCSDKNPSTTVHLLVESLNNLKE